MHRTASLAALLVADPAAGQRTEWLDLIRQLGDPMRRDHAIAEMDRMGAESLQRLAGLVNVEHPDPEFFYAIAELAHHAEAASPSIAGFLGRLAVGKSRRARELREIVMPFVSLRTRRDLAIRAASRHGCLPDHHSSPRTAPLAGLPAEELLPPLNIESTPGELLAALEGARHAVDPALIVAWRGGS